VLEVELWAHVRLGGRETSGWGEGRSPTNSFSGRRVVATARVLGMAAWATPPHPRDQRARLAGCAPP
jgi:hypothetical protein